MRFARAIRVRIDVATSAPASLAFPWLPAICMWASYKASDGSTATHRDYAVFRFKKINNINLNLEKTKVGFNE